MGVIVMGVVSVARRGRRHRGHEAIQMPVSSPVVLRLA